MRGVFIPMSIDIKPSNSSNSAILNLLQIANSSFPTGAFNHSYGFETLINDGSIHDASSFGEHCFDWLIYGLAKSDGAGMALSHRAMIQNNLEELIYLDEQVGALKTAREIREASVKTGLAMLSSLQDIFKLNALVPYAEAVKKQACSGHQAVVFGIGSAALDINEYDSVLAFLQSSFSNLIGVGSRIIPLGQVESQNLIRQAAPMFIEAAEIAMAANRENLSSSTFGLDLAAMEHERLYSRLCMS